MNKNILDETFQELENFCLHQMTEKSIPATFMSYVVNRLLSEIYSMHICELSVKQETEKDEELEKNEETEKIEVPIDTLMDAIQNNNEKEGE